MSRIKRQSPGKSLDRMFLYGVLVLVFSCVIVLGAIMHGYGDISINIGADGLRLDMSR